MSEQQKIFASISGSVIGHMLLLICIFLGLTSSRTIEPLSAEKKKNEGPKEVTVMLPDFMEQIEIPRVLPESPKQKQFLNTDGNTDSKIKPKTSGFESDRNTVAETEMLPDTTAAQTKGITLRGDKRINSLELEDQNFSAGKSKNTPNTLESEMKTKSERIFADPNSTSDARSLKKEMETSSTDNSIVRRKNNVNGTLTNKGKNAVDAVETPLGHYKKSVTDTIAKKWHQYRNENAESVTWGTLRLKFNVNPEGKIMKLTVTENSGNEKLLDLTLKSISETELEPMSDEVAAELGASGLSMKYDVIIY